MREFNHEEVTYRLTEEEYYILLRRFDTSRVTLVGNWSCIRIQCICRLHEDCNTCGLAYPGVPSVANCLDIQRSMFGKYPPDLYFISLIIRWLTANTESAAYITKIRDALLTLKRS